MNYPPIVYTEDWLCICKLVRGDAFQGRNPSPYKVGCNKLHH